MSTPHGVVGREQEVGLLLERWQQAKDGQGQVTLLSGEAGIGKSRLVQVLKDHLEETVPLFANLLSLPLPEDRYPPCARKLTTCWHRCMDGSLKDLILRI
jgi:hypothetical protein